MPLQRRRANGSSKSFVAGLTPAGKIKAKSDGQLVAHAANHRNEGEGR